MRALFLSRDPSGHPFDSLLSRASVSSGTGLDGASSPCTPPSLDSSTLDAALSSVEVRHQRHQLVTLGLGPRMLHLVSSCPSFCVLESPLVSILEKGTESQEE